MVLLALNDQKRQFLSFFIGLCLTTTILVPSSIAHAESNATPLALHHWNSSLSFALLDLDTGNDRTGNVQLITNDLNLTTNPSLLLNITKDFSSNNDIDPSRTLVAYSTWSNITAPPLRHDEPFSNFHVTSTFPFFRYLNFSSSFPTEISFNLSHLTIGTPSILASISDSKGSVYFFKQQFLGLSLKVSLPNIESLKTQEALQSSGETLLLSYLITNPEMLEILQGRLNSLGIEVPSFESSIPIIRLQKHSIQYILKNPIFLFQESVPEEIVPFSGIRFPSSPKAIIFSKNLTVTVSFAPYYSPSGSHLIITTDMVLHPIEWMLLKESVNASEFNNVTTITVPSLEPINNNSSQEFTLYYQRDDIEKRLSDPQYSRVELSFMYGLQLLALRMEQSSVRLESISPVIDNQRHADTWDENVRSLIVSNNITYNDLQSDAQENQWPIAVLPTFNESLSFNYMGSQETAGTQETASRQFQIMSSTWSVLNPQLHDPLNPATNPYLNYFMKSQASYHAEAMLAISNDFLSKEQAARLSRPSLQQNLNALLPSQQILEVSFGQWSGNGIIHETRTDLIQTVNTTALKPLNNGTRENDTSNSIIPSFQFLTTLSMLLAITFLIRRRRRFA